MPFNWVIGNEKNKHFFFHSSATIPFWISYLNPVVHHVASFFLFLSQLAFLVVSVEVLKALLPASEIFWICLLFFLLLLCLGLLKRLDISRNCAVESWLYGLKVLNILYLCMSFLSRSSYPFVVSSFCVYFQTNFNHLKVFWTTTVWL